MPARHAAVEPFHERGPGAPRVLAALHAAAADRVQERSQPDEIGDGLAGEAGRGPGAALVGGPEEPRPLDAREQDGIDRRRTRTARTTARRPGATSPPALRKVAPASSEKRSPARGARPRAPAPAIRDAGPATPRSAVGAEGEAGVRATCTSPSDVPTNTVGSHVGIPRRQHRQDAGAAERALPGVAVVVRDVQPAVGAHVHARTERDDAVDGAQPHQAGVPQLLPVEPPVPRAVGSLLRAREDRQRGHDLGPVLLLRGRLRAAGTDQRGSARPRAAQAPRVLTTPPPLPPRRPGSSSARP